MKPLPLAYSTVINAPFQSNDVPSGLDAMQEYLLPGYIPDPLHVHLLMLLAPGHSKAAQLLQQCPLPTPPHYDPDYPLFREAHALASRPLWDVLEGPLLEWAVTRWEEDPRALLHSLPPGKPRWDVSRAVAAVAAGLDTLPGAQTSARLLKLLLDASRTKPPGISPSALSASLIDLLADLPPRALLEACVVMTDPVVLAGTIRRITHTLPGIAACRTWSDLAGKLQDPPCKAEGVDAVRVGILQVGLVLPDDAAVETALARLEAAVAALGATSSNLTRIPALARQWAGGEV